MDIDAQGSTSTSKKRRITTQTNRVGAPTTATGSGVFMSARAAVLNPPTVVVLKSCDGVRFSCSIAALAFSFRTFATMLDLPQPADVAGSIQEVDMTEQAVVLEKLLRIVDQDMSTNVPVRLDDVKVKDLQVPTTTDSAGNEDAPPQEELDDMEAQFRLVALAIEAAVKFEASRPIVDSLAWFLRPYAHYRPLQAYALATKLGHHALQSEVSVQFLNYNLTIIKNRFWDEIGPSSALKVYQLHYNRQHHIFKSVQTLLADEFEAVSSETRCKSASEHRVAYLRILGDWLATPGHDWEDLKLWVLNEGEPCPVCTRHFSALVARLKESYTGPDRLPD